MKKILVLLAALALTACSSGGGSNAKPADGPRVTEFGQKIAGVWISECTTGQEGPYKETLTINADGTGENAITIYQGLNCTGAVRGTQAPSAFTYSVESLGEAAARVTITKQGAQAVVNVTILGNVLDVEGQNGKIRYLLNKNAQVPTTPAGDDFDALARGLWITEQCYPYENNTSARQQLTVNGRGSASTVVQVYASQNCSGRSRAERTQQTNYRVDQFANGQGQITVNNEASTVSFDGNHMTLTDANGTTVYNKVN